jgi:hypothetical protein
MLEETAVSSLINIEGFLQKMKNRKPFVIAAPIILGLMAGGVLVVKPQLKKLTFAKTELRGLQDKQAVYQMILDGEKKAEAVAGRFKGDKTWLIEQINTISQNTGLSILTSVPEDTKKIGDFLERHSVRIEAEGDFHELGEFVSRVESLDGYVKVLNVNINAEKGSMSSSGPMGPAPTRLAPTNVYSITISIGVFSPAAGVP